MLATLFGEWGAALNVFHTFSHAHMTLEASALHPPATRIKPCQTQHQREAGPGGWGCGLGVADWSPGVVLGGWGRNGSRVSHARRSSLGERVRRARSVRAFGGDPPGNGQNLGNKRRPHEARACLPLRPMPPQGMHWKTGRSPPPPGRPANRQQLSPPRQVPASMALANATDSNRPQPLWQPPPTACLTAAAAASEAPSLLMHPSPPPPAPSLHVLLRPVGGTEPKCSPINRNPRRG